MTDPYSILGVSPSATDEEVKKAYRDLARKYHPDNYHDNPLADLAQEKMKEINEAYDTITKSRTSGGGYSSGGYSAGQGYSQGNSGYGGGAGYSGGAYSGGSAQFSQVRAALNSGNLDLAERLLNASQTRDAEWNYLMGQLYYQKGWMDEAKNFYQRACQMEPANMVYRNALTYMTGGGQAYRPYGYARNTGGPDMCDICTTMMCMNMLCGGCR